MREKIVVNNVYHVLNRGVDKRKIFLDDGDRFRFIHDLFEFNDVNPINNVAHRFKTTYNVIARRYVGNNSSNGGGRKPRKLLAEILAFCLMPNHYHLMLKAKSEDGITRFVKRLNMGYARYFNEKYKRSGALFEGRYKLVAVTKEAHFIHLPYYIHFNPLDIAAPEWRKRELKNYKRAVKFLENYRWSSHLDYLGKKNFPSLTSRKFLLEFFGGTKEYGRRAKEWLSNIDLENIADIALE